MELITHLKRRRNGGEELLAFRTDEGWPDIRSSDINAYLKDLAGRDVSAKDFRTWHATVFAAVRLALADGVPSVSQRRTISLVAREVADALGNSPTVARNSYIDPRVFDRLAEGETIHSAMLRLDETTMDDPTMRAEIETAVLRLIRGDVGAISAAARFTLNASYGPGGIEEPGTDGVMKARHDT